MASSASGFNLGGNGGNGGRRPSGSKRGTKKNNNNKRLSGGKAAAPSSQGGSSFLNNLLAGMSTKLQSKNKNNKKPYSRTQKATPKKIEDTVLTVGPKYNQTYGEYLREITPSTSYFNAKIKPLLVKYNEFDREAVRPYFSASETLGDYLKRIEAMFENKNKPSEPYVPRPYVPPTQEELAERRAHELAQRQAWMAAQAFENAMESRRGPGFNHWRSSTR
jgi:hypothetical protein